MIDMALNHIVAPHLDAASFCAAASRLGCAAIEVRLDIGLNGDDAASIKRHTRFFAEEADRHGLQILALSELGTFDVWNDSRSEQARKLADLAAAANIPAICLIPSNDGANSQAEYGAKDTAALQKSERMARLRAAMLGIQPILSERGLMGYIEPLGFDTASLRLKDEVVEMIEELDLKSQFKLIHDTFHHALAGGGPVYPDHTALVHVSGVEDQALSFNQMRDCDRVLVTERDQLGTIAQIKQLRDAGYRGPISFEPFAKSVQEADDLEAQLSKSIHFIEDQLQLNAA